MTLAHRCFYCTNCSRRNWGYGDWRATMTLILQKNASNASDSAPLWSTIGTNNKSNQLATKTSRCILRSKHLNQDPSCSFLIFHLHGHHDFFVWKLDWTMGRHTVWGDKIENGLSNKKVWLAWLCVQTAEGRMSQIETRHKYCWHCLMYFNSWWENGTFYSRSLREVPSLVLV